MYKAVFIDVDGTLIKNDHSVSEATKDIIQKLKGKNIHVILVSARPLSAIEPIAAKVGLLNSPLASLNGAYIAFGGNIIFDSVINSSIAKILHQQVQKFNATVIYYQQDLWFSQTKDYYTDYEQKITSVPIIIQPFKDTLKLWRNMKTGPNKALMIADEVVINSIHKDIKQNLKEELNMFASKPTYLEVINKKASKLNTVRFLMNRFNIKKKEIIAIGDNFNDKDMIEYAGLGIAMGNAPHEVKAVADYVTDTNNNDGVFKALNKIFQ